MKQTIFMVLMTLAGTFGVFLVSPFWGVAVYYLFSVLRPQFIWEWVLPQVGWSSFVGWATIAGVVAWKLGLLAVPGVKGGQGGAPRNFSFAHRAVLMFGAWVCLTWVTAIHPEVSYPYLVEYVKIFVFFLVATLVIRKLDQVWFLFLLTAGTLAYIAYEMNAIYFFQGGFLYIYRRGFGGLDNNGAALMIAMGVPLCFFAWEGIRRWYRWAFIAIIPAFIHAVLMSYSRGAMLSLIVAVPLLVLRSRRRLQLGLILGVVALLIPVLAGKEIQARFLTITQNEADESANSRRTSWAIAWQMAKEHPVFGMGIRNSNLYTYDYGADMPGRTIHSQYLQTAADSGLVALGLYLVALSSVWLSTRRARRWVAGRKDPDALRAYAVACGVESSLFVFCFGAVFLSLENFELPYLVMLLGAQLGVVSGVREAPAAPASPAQGRRLPGLPATLAAR